MANVYVDSNAAGAATGADWGNAYTTLNAALTAQAAGDVFWVAHNHAESAGTTKTHTSPGTTANPCFIYCATSAGSVPPVSANLRTTATVTTTGAFGMNFAGAAYCYGIIFSAGNSAGTATINVGSATVSSWVMEACALRLGGTSSSSIINLAQAGGDCFIRLKNTTVQFGAVGQSMRISGRVIWENTASAVTGATIPTTLFSANSGGGAGNLWCECVDLSALGSGNILVGTGTSSGVAMQFKDCKLGASVTMATTPVGLGAPNVDFYRTDSSATNYRHERYRYTGTQTVETTIVRTGGASDGTTSISQKIITTANSKWVLPFEALPIAIWNDTSGSSVTVTLFGIWGGGAVPNNDDIWFDLEYLGSTLTPQGSFATASKADNLATGSALTSDTSTWGGSTTKFKMAITVTPQQKGAMYIYVKAAAASQTFYIDPKPVLS